jgi:hypothetical protein
MSKILSVLIVLVGIALAVTPWVFQYTADRAAFGGAVIGGLVVAVLGALIYGTVTSSGRLPRSQH